MILSLHLKRSICMKKLFIALIVLAGLVYLLFSTFFVDMQINKYADKEIVIEQQAIANGWIPSILPESSFDIVETHNIDKNTLFGSFKYKEVDEKVFMKNLSKLNDDSNTSTWKNFLFRVDSKKNVVKFRNKP